MATDSEVQAELLDIVDLLQAPIDQDAPKPTFESETNESPPTGIVEMAKRTLAQSYASEEILRSDNEPAPEETVKEQFFKAVNFAAQLPKDTRLETFNSFHQECAAQLINVFYRISVNNLKEAIKYAQTRVSESVLSYALLVSLYHREEAIDVNLQLPSDVNTHPEMYFDIGKITKDLKNDQVAIPIKSENGDYTKRYVDIHDNFTATNQDPEHKVAYFREDIGLNLHHRHWHEVYPFDAEEIIVKKDRRGELFYYMHQQIVARYNFERLCNGLPKAKAYADFREPVEEAYFPKLDSLSKASQFCSRSANAMLKDLHREFFYIKLSTMERWRDRIFDAIDRGYAYAINRETNEEFLKKIDEETGIDELGNSVEAVEKLSWNPKYYGDMHNKGHLFFSYVHDPDHRFRENGSVMSHSETALRDPIFYRWHVFIDDIFQHYKRTLKPYTVQQREFKGITIKNVKIEPQSDEQSPKNNEEHSAENPYHTKNVIKTFWEKDAVDVTKGILDQDVKQTKDQVYAVFTHLQHQDFEYVIDVTNDHPAMITGTVRIFMAPRFDESGLQMTFNGQRRMFIEMDKFTCQLDPGSNTIRRQSTESSVTIPFEKSFMTLTDVRKLAEDPKLNENLNKALTGYCSCGWPHHLLVGKGTSGGFLCDLFVMITDYELDKVEESPLAQKCCDKSSLSYCGVRNKKYPDKKPMGFPFDRDISDVNATIEDFMTEKQASPDKNNPKNQEIKRPPRLSNNIVVQLKVKHITSSTIKYGKSLQTCGYANIKRQNSDKISA